VLAARVGDPAAAARACVAATAARAGTPLPPDYERLFRIWFTLGWPAFLGVIAIFAIMIFKPQLW